MGVLKSIRKRNQGVSRRLHRRKKMLNYSSISNGSGDTVQEDIDDLNEATTPLFLEDLRTSSKLTTVPNESAGPHASSLALFHDPDKPLKQTKKHPKRTPLDPVGPLGVVVNENEWDAISHISGISTHTSSTTKSPPSSHLCNMSSEEIQNDLAMMTLNTPTAAVDMPNVVSPGPEDKKELSALNDSRDGSKESSRNDSASDEGADVKINVVTHDAEDSQIVRILKTADSNDGVSQDGTGSKVSHVFEGEQNSTSNVVATDNTTSVATTSIYSEGLPMPTTVSPSITPGKNEANPSPVFEVSDADRPSIHGAVTPSFDGSTATVETNNVTKSGASIGAATQESNSITEPVSKGKIHQKINEMEATMRSTYTRIGGDTECFKSVNGPPHCDAFFSSTSTLSENFKDSLEQIKRELTGLYEKSGLASASSSMPTCLEESLSAVKGCAEPNIDEQIEVSFSTVDSDKEVSYSTAGSGTEYTVRTENTNKTDNTNKSEFNNILTLSTVSEEDSKINLETESQEDPKASDVNVSRSHTQASF